MGGLTSDAIDAEADIVALGSEIAETTEAEPGIGLLGIGVLMLGIELLGVIPKFG